MAGETLPNLRADSRGETARGGFEMPAERDFCVLPHVQGVRGSQRCSQVCLFTQVQKYKKKNQFQLLFGEIRAARCIPMLLHPFACSCGKDAQRGFMDKAASSDTLGCFPRDSLCAQSPGGLRASLTCPHLAKCFKFAAEFAWIWHRMLLVPWLQG